MRADWLSAMSSGRSLIFHDGSFIGSTQFAHMQRNIGECSEWTWMQPNNIGECSGRTWMQPKFLQRGLRRWGNGEGSWILSVMATLRAWKWWRQLGTPVIATFRNDRTSFHGGGRGVYDGLSLNQHCCSKTSTGEATYSKIKGLDDCFTEMRKSYTSLFVHKIYVRVRPKGFPLSHRLRKFSTIIWSFAIHDKRV